MRVLDATIHTPQISLVWDKRVEMINKRKLPRKLGELHTYTLKYRAYPMPWALSVEKGVNTKSEKTNNITCKSEKHHTFKMTSCSGTPLVTGFASPSFVHAFQWHYYEAKGV